MKVLVLLCSMIVFTSFVTASFGYNNLDGPILTPFPVTFNNNTAYVNSTEIWITNLGPLDYVSDTQFNNIASTLTIDTDWLDSLYCQLTGCTMTGDIDMSNNNIENVGNVTGVDFLAFNITGCPDEIDTTLEGYMCWDSNKHVLNMVTGLGNIVQMSQEMFYTVRNKAGQTIYAGQLVSSNSSSGEIIEVVLADANATDPKIHNLGVVTIPSCNANAECIITRVGEVHDIPTDSFTEGDNVYLSCDGSGNFTNVRQPILECYHKYLGKVTRSHPETGIVDFQPEIELENGITMHQLGVLTNLTVLDGIYSNNWSKSRISIYNLSDVTNSANNLDFLQWNQSGQVWEPVSLETVYYNATELQMVTGTNTSGIQVTQHPNGGYDGVTLNLTEQVASPALDARINFSDGITLFNNGIMRYKTDVQPVTSSFPIIQLWDYDDEVWETYGQLGESPDFSVIEQGVFDSSDHVQNGVVQMRLYKDGTGNTNNEYQIDWLAIAKGYGTPAAEEVDPFAIHKDGTTPWMGNENGNGYNSSGWSYINGVNISNLGGIYRTLDNNTFTIENSTYINGSTIEIGEIYVYSNTFPYFNVSYASIIGKSYYDSAFGIDFSDSIGVNRDLSIISKKTNVHPSLQFIDNSGLNDGYTYITTSSSGGIFTMEFKNAGKYSFDDNILGGGEIRSSDDLVSLKDIIGYDNLYLGSANPSSANFRAYDTGNVHIDSDSAKLYTGEGQDASIYYDGTNMKINPAEIGNGSLNILGNVNITGNITSDNSTWGYYNQNNCIVIGDLSYVSEC